MKIFTSVKNKRSKQSPNGIIDLESARELSLRAVELDLPDPDTFVKEQFHDLWNNCSLDRYNNHSVDEYIDSYAHHHADIEGKLALRRRTAELFSDQYRQFFCITLRGKLALFTDEQTIKGIGWKRKRRKKF